MSKSEVKIIVNFIILLMGLVSMGIIVKCNGGFKAVDIAAGYAGFSIFAIMGIAIFLVFVIIIVNSLIEIIMD